MLSPTGTRNKKTMNKGNITQVIGPVVDIEFEVGKLPKIYDAVTIDYELDSKNKIGNRVVEHLWRKHCTCEQYWHYSCGMQLDGLSSKVMDKEAVVQAILFRYQSVQR